MAFDLDAAMRLAGFAIAHAAWSIEDGETLIPLAFVERDQSRELIRWVDLIGDPDVLIRSELRDRLDDDSMAAVVLDAFATVDGGLRRDALIVQLLGPTAVPRATVLQPYVRGHRRFLFAGARRGLRLLDLEIADVTPESAPACVEAVLSGTRMHPEGPRLFPSTFA